MLTGSRTGVRVGLAVGIGADEGSDPLAGVARDSTSQKLVPDTASQWTTLLTVIGSALAAPHHLWRLQEPSGNPADSIGAKPLTATVAGAAPTYGKTIPGWTRKAIGGNGGATNTSLANGTMVDTATTSFLVLAICRAAAATVIRDVVAYGTQLVRQPISNKIRAQSGANLIDSTGDHAGAVHPCLISYNQTGTFKLYTDLEKLTPTFTLSSGAAMTFRCSSTGDATAADFLYAAAWNGVTITDAEAKKLLQGLAWTIPWS